MVEKKEKKADESEDFSDLDDVAKTVVVSTGGKSFPVKLAEVLKFKFDDVGAFAIPKDWLEEKLGYDSDRPMKGRPNAYKRKLNKQHRDLLDDGFIWHVGSKDNGKYYTIAIIEATPEEIKKWQE